MCSGFSPRRNVREELSSRNNAYQVSPKEISNQSGLRHGFCSLVPLRVVRGY